MWIFSVLNFSIIISFLFIGGLLLIGTAIGIADFYAYSSSHTFFDTVMLYLIIPIMFELIFIICSVVLSFIFYFFVNQKMPYRKLLLYITYYINALFFTTINIFVILMTWGLILFFIFIIKKVFDIKNKTVLEILNWIPQRFKNNAIRIKESFMGQKI